MASKNAGRNGHMNKATTRAGPRQRSSLDADDSYQITEPGEGRVRSPLWQYGYPSALRRVFGGYDKRLSNVSCEQTRSRLAKTVL